MESAVRQTARVHEHELCLAFARNAPQRRHAKRSGWALSTWARSDYENSDGECHARLWYYTLHPAGEPIVSLPSCFILLLAGARDGSPRYFLGRSTEGESEPDGD